MQTSPPPGRGFVRTVSSHAPGPKGSGRPFRPRRGGRCPAGLGGLPPAPVPVPVPPALPELSPHMRLSAGLCPLPRGSLTVPVTGFALVTPSGRRLRRPGALVPRLSQGRGGGRGCWCREGDGGSSRPGVRRVASSAREGQAPATLSKTRGGPGRGHDRRGGTRARGRLKEASPPPSPDACPEADAWSCHRPQGRAAASPQVPLERGACRRLPRAQPFLLFPPGRDPSGCDPRSGCPQDPRRHLLTPRDPMGSVTRVEGNRSSGAGRQRVLSGRLCVCPSAPAMPWSSRADAAHCALRKAPWSWS